MIRPKMECKTPSVLQMSCQVFTPFKHYLSISIIFGSSLNITLYSFSGTISWRMYPWFLPLFPLLPVDFPYYVVIYPSSCSAPTLLLLLESFLMFYILQFSFCVVLALKFFIFSSCFIHVLSSDILFFIKTVHWHVTALFFVLLTQFCSYYYLKQVITCISSLESLTRVPSFLPLLPLL